MLVSPYYSFFQKAYNSLSAMAWVAYTLNNGKDADDYLHTLAVAYTLIDEPKISTEHFLTTLCSPQNRAIGGGMQFMALLQSANPANYRAIDGITTGACMRVLPIVTAFAHNTPQMLQTLQTLTLATHHTPEALLSAAIIALQYHQLLLNNSPCPNHLVEILYKAINYWGISSQESGFFLKKVHQAEAVYQQYKHDTIRLLQELIQHIGITHMAWSLPITACFASFAYLGSYKIWANPMLLGLKGKKIILHPTTWAEYQQYLHSIHHEHKYNLRYGAKWKEHQWADADWDTFLFLSFSFQAMQHGLLDIKAEAPKAIRFFGHDLHEICHKLVGLQTAQR